MDICMYVCMHVRRRRGNVRRRKPDEAYYQPWRSIGSITHGPLSLLARAGLSYVALARAAVVAA